MKPSYSFKKHFLKIIFGKIVLKSLMILGGKNVLIALS